MVVNARDLSLSLSLSISAPLALGGEFPLPNVVGEKPVLILPAHASQPKLFTPLCAIWVRSTSIGPTECAKWCQAKEENVAKLVA